MKTEEDEAFDEIARKQGGGFMAKRAMAADKLQEPAQEPTNYLHAVLKAFGPDEGISLDQKCWSNLHAAIQAVVTQPAQEPVAVVVANYALHWVGSGSIAPLIEKHRIKVGDKLYTAPTQPTQPAQEPMASVHIKDGCLVGSHRKDGPFPDGQYGLWPIHTTPFLPAQEPIAYVTGMSFGRFIVEPLNPAMVLPVGMALYFAPQENK